MSNAANTIKTRTGNVVIISATLDSRIKSLVWSDGVALIVARSGRAAVELSREFEALGANVEEHDRNGLSVW